MHRDDRATDGRAADEQFDDGASAIVAGLDVRVARGWTGQAFWRRACGPPLAIARDAAGLNVATLVASALRSAPDLRVDRGTRIGLFVAGVDVGVDAGADADADTDAGAAAGAGAGVGLGVGTRVEVRADVAATAALAARAARASQPDAVAGAVALAVERSAVAAVAHAAAALRDGRCDIAVTLALDANRHRDADEDDVQSAAIVLRPATRDARGCATLRAAPATRLEPSSGVALPSPRVGPKERPEASAGEPFRESPRPADADRTSAEAGRASVPTRATLPDRAAHGLVAMCRAAGVDPRSITLLDLQAADRDAIAGGLRALAPAMSRGGETLSHCAVAPMLPPESSSAVASMLGIIAAALAVHHRVLPPFASPHRDIVFAPFCADPAPRPWIDATPRRAAVWDAEAACGLLIEQRVEAALCHAPARPIEPDWPFELALISAPTRAALADRLRERQARIAANPGAALRDLACPPEADRRHDVAEEPFRAAIVARDAEDLARKLERLAAIVDGGRDASVQTPDGLAFADASDAARALDGRTALIFPGQGAQYPGMFGDLCLHVPALQTWFERLHDVRPEGDRCPPGLLVAPPRIGLTADDRRALDQALVAVSRGALATLTACLGLHALLRAAGVRADAMAGYSNGENAALTASGAWKQPADGDIFTMFRRVLTREDDQGDVPRGLCIAVNQARPEAVRAVLDEAGDRLFVALENCPQQCVLYGEPDAARAAARQLKASGAICIELAFDRPHHTALYASRIPHLRAFYDTFDIRDARMPVYSCATAAPFPADPAEARELAVSQWARCVRFGATVERMYADGIRCFIEVGPGSTLTGFVRSTLRGRPHLALASNVAGRPGLEQLLQLLGRLFVLGHAIDLAAIRPSTEFEAEPEARPASALARAGSPDARSSAAVPSDTATAPAAAVAAAVPSPFADSRRYAAPPSAPPGPSVASTDARVPAEHGRPHEREAVSHQPPAASTPVADPRHLAMAAAAPPTAPLPASLAPVASSAPHPLAASPHDRQQAAGEAVAHQASAAFAPVVGSGAGGSAQSAFVPVRGERQDAAVVAAELAASVGSVPSAASMASAALASGARIFEQHTALMREFLAAQQRAQARFVSAVSRGPAVVSRTTPAATVPAPAPSLHVDPWPMLGDRVHLRDGGRRLEATRALNPATDGFLAHHVLGRLRTPHADPLSGLPVVPFTFSLELAAEAAARLAGWPPGAIALRQVRGSRWLAVEADTLTLEIVAETLAPDRIRVRIFDADATIAAPAAASTVTITAAARAVPDARVPAFEAIASPRPSPPPAETMRPTRRGTSRTSAADFNARLFHGPLLRTIDAVTAADDAGVTVRTIVPPTRGLFASSDVPALRLPAAVLDAASQFPAVWLAERGLQRFGVFPFELKQYEQFIPAPASGTALVMDGDVLVTGPVTSGSIAITDERGAPVARLDGLKTWIYEFPERYFRYVFERTLAGRLSDRIASDAPSLVRRRLPPLPASLVEQGQGIWLRVLAAVALSPRERRAWIARPVSERLVWLQTRLVAKEIVLDLLAQHGLTCAPVDLETDAHDARDVYSPGIVRVYGDVIARSPLGQAIDGGLDIEIAIAPEADGHACAASARAGSAHYRNVV